MKRLLLVWLRGKKEIRISAGQAKEITTRLLNLQRFVPSLFARKPRSLEEIDRWKATEFRQFLLYTGKLVLKGILQQDLYDHFLVLSTALCILVCPRLTQEHSQYAHRLLKYFVSKSKELYGNEFIVYNVHCLIHLANDAVEYGGLDGCSAFLFENYLQEMKRLIRSTKNPLVQIIKRLQESKNAEYGRTTSCKDSKISLKRPNNVFMLQDFHFCEVVSTSNEKDESGNKLLLCRVYQGTQPMFNDPCNSCMIGVGTVQRRNTRMTLLPRSKLDKRAMLIELDQRKCLFMAILHDF